MSNIDGEQIGKQTSTTSEAGAREGCVISMANIRSAISEFVPSLSDEERARYELLYKNFVQSRGGQFVDASKAEKKVTHA